MKNRITIILLYLIFVSNVCAQESGTFTLDYSNTSLEAVIQHLDENSDYSFSYSSSSIPVDTKVDLQVKGVSLMEALNAALQYLPVTYQVVNKNIILQFNQLHQTIRGSILDKDTHQPIFGATVLVAGSQPLLGATTQMDGVFKIAQVPVGRHFLKINYLGYEEQVIPVLLGSGKELVMEIELVESVMKMEEIIVQAVGEGSQPLNEMIQVSGRSFTVEETKRFPVSLGDPLRLATSFAGVMNADDGANEIIIRGNTPRGILWKLEGVEIPGPNHFSNEGAATGGISMLSTQVMSRSDFSTGAFAPEYGNALSGVFDLHLRKGNNEKTEKTIKAGFLGLNTALEGPIGKKGSSYLFNYRYSTLGILGKMGIINTDGEVNIFQDLSFNINMPTTRAGRFSIFGLGGLSTFEDIVGEYRDKEDYNLGVTGIKHQIALNKSSFLRSTLSWSGTNIIDDYVDEGNTIQYTSFKKNFWRAQLLYNKKFNAKHLLELGTTLSKLNFAFDETDIDYDRNGNELPVRILFNDHGNTSTQQGFASWQYRISDDITLVNGFHVFRFAMNNETTFEPRSSLKWKFTPSQSVYFGYGVHSRMESLEYYLGNGFDVNGNLVDYNRNLKVTKANHFIMGYDKTFLNNMYFKVETYYQELYDIPIVELENFLWFSTINNSDGYSNAPLVNEGTGRNYGVEFTLDKKFSNDHYFMANVSVFNSKYMGKDRVERNTRFNGNYTANVLGGKEWKVGKNDKNNIFGLSFKASASGNQRYIPLDPNADFSQGDTGLFTDRIYTQNYPHYFRLDVQINYRKNKPKHTSEWRIDIQNVTNRRNIVGQYVNSGQEWFEDSGLGLIPVLSYRIEF
ncbi:MAG: TonB-dependent receptor [Cyclobacteriaceae bacterium]